MTELKQQNTKNPDLQENFIIDDLTQKIQSISEDINQLKKGLNTLTIDQQNEEIDIIEKTISECLDELTNLEIDGESSIDKKQLEELKIQIDKLTKSKENIKEEIKVQTSESLNELNQTVSQSELQSDLNQNRWGKTKSFVSEQWKDIFNKEKWKEESGKNVLRTAGFVATGVGAISLLVGLGKRIFGKKDDIEDDEKKDEKKDEENQKKKSRKEKRAERRKKRREKRQERRKNRPGRQKFLIGSAIVGGTAVGGVQVYKHWNQIASRIKEKFGLALSFDEAKQKVEDEVRNGKIDDDHFGVFNSNFENGITFDEQTQEICSYDQKTKIDKKNKKLEGLDVSFASYEELIHAANIVNFAKRKLRGRGATARPFGQTEWGGDIAFNCSANGKQEFLSASNSNEWSLILGTIGVVGGGILGSYCAGVKGAAVGGLAGGAGGYALGAYIDNTSAAGCCCSTIARGKNFDLFILYLNDQKDENGKSLWESAGEQHIDPNGSPISGLVDNGAENMGEWKGILAEIEKEYGEDQTGRRNLNIIRNELNPTEYTIESFGQRTKLIVEGLPTKKGDTIDYSEITKIHIEKYADSDWGDGLDIEFPKTKEGLEEAIRTVNLTNMIREDWSGKGRQDYSFSCGRFIGLDGRSLYFDAGEFNGKGTRLLDRETLKEKYPTIFKDITKEGIIFSNYQKEYHNQAINDELTGSQYIKFLHQMGKGEYWKKI